MLVTSEASKIRKKKEEEERRRMMAEGFEKLQAALDAKVAERMAVQKVNEGLKAVRKKCSLGLHCLCVHLRVVRAASCVKNKSHLPRAHSYTHLVLLMFRNNLFINNPFIKLI